MVTRFEPASKRLVARAFANGYSGYNRYRVEVRRPLAHGLFVTERLEFEPGSVRGILKISSSRFFGRGVTSTPA
jgi:hypothetical protein